jgi:hypothetical protein
MNQINPYRVTVTPIDRSRDLIALATAYEKRRKRGDAVLPLFAGSLIPLSNPSTLVWLLLCAIPCALTTPFMILSFSERVADVPVDVTDRARAVGLTRHRMEPRGAWVWRIVYAEYDITTAHRLCGI